MTNVPPVQLIFDDLYGAPVERVQQRVKHAQDPVLQILVGFQRSDRKPLGFKVLATALFTEIVDSTRRAAEIGDRDWHALLDAHDAVVRAHNQRVARSSRTSGIVWSPDRDTNSRLAFSRCAPAFARTNPCGPGNQPKPFPAGR
jgi:hypothetical protein